MGRYFRRVPYDWNYPIDRAWIGYINPHQGIRCPCCGGNGISPEAQKIFDSWKEWEYQLTEDEVEALYEHKLLQLFFNGKPSAKEVNEYAKSNLYFHTYQSQYICCKLRCEKSGIELKCPYCHGKGLIFGTKEQEKLYEEWEKTDPPLGDGYQLWQNTSEDSPISPIFKTIEDASKWCADNATIFGHDKMSEDEWCRWFGGNKPELFKRL